MFVFVFCACACVCVYVCMCVCVCVCVCLCVTPVLMTFNGSRQQHTTGRGVRAAGGKGVARGQPLAVSAALKALDGAQAAAQVDQERRSLRHMKFSLPLLL